MSSQKQKLIEQEKASDQQMKSTQKKDQSDRKSEEMMHSLEIKNQIQINRNVRVVESRDFLIYPPTTQEELRYIMTEYFLSELFDYPIHSTEIMQKIKGFFNQIPNIEFLMRNLDITPILKQISEKRGCDIQTYPVGTRLEDFIVDVNFEKLKQLCREFYKDRPLTIPSVLPTISSENQMSFNTPIKKTTSPFTASLYNRVSFSGSSEVQKPLFAEDFINKPTASEESSLRADEEKLNLIKGMSASDYKALEKFRNKQMRKITYCDFGTQQRCDNERKSIIGGSMLNILPPCQNAHFIKLIRPHTDENLGNCSYLDTCIHMDYCQFIHYQLDIYDEKSNGSSSLNGSNIGNNNSNLSGASGSATNGGMGINGLGIGEIGILSEQVQPQWICCDLRHIDFRVLGKFDIVMADPPWDIHMKLPYGTLKDKEMKALRVDLIQEEGLLFLWVTGRAMQLGRECMKEWGYTKVEQIIWVKTNQLQRIIRTGRTGHWLNHSQEHCLVGIKGLPKINQNLDCDVIVSEVRETSRQPDEIYGLIERIVPGSKCIELFGRPHNCKPGWVTLGNQLPGIYIKDQEILNRYKETYPQEDLSDETMNKNQQRLVNEQLNDQVYNQHINPSPHFRVPLPSSNSNASTGNNLSQSNTSLNNQF